MNLVLKLFSSPWFWADVFLSVAGGIIVYWGLSIEKKAEKLIPPADFKPDIFKGVLESQKSEMERGWRILMAGITVEVVAALGISIISGLEIADLTEKSAAANLEAKQAGKDAAEARLETAKLQKQVEHMKKMRVSDLSFSTNLTKIPEMAVDLKFINEQEPYLTATTLIQSFSMGGWTIADFEPITNESVMQVPYGIAITYGIKSSSGLVNEKSREAAELLFQSLTNEGEPCVLYQVNETNSFNVVKVKVGRNCSPETQENFKKHMDILNKWMKERHITPPP
jgi:hypothetical protein